MIEQIYSSFLNSDLLISLKEAKSPISKIYKDFGWIKKRQDIENWNAQEFLSDEQCVWNTVYSQIFWLIVRVVCMLLLLVLLSSFLNKTSILVILIIYIYNIYEIRSFLKLTQETVAGMVLIKNMPKHLYARPLPQYLTQPTSSFGLF